MGEAGENHGDGVIGGDERLELVNDGGEDWVQESLQGAPTSVEERRIEIPDVVGD